MTNSDLATLMRTLHAETKSQLSELGNKIKKLETDQQQMKAAIQTLQTENQLLKTRLNANNIVIHGIPYDENENSETLFNETKKIFEENLKLEGIDIDTVQRLNSEKGIGPVVVKLLYQREKNLILASGRLMKGTSIGISHDLPKSARVRESIFRKEIKKASTTGKQWRRNGDKLIIDGLISEGII